MQDSARRTVAFCDLINSCKTLAVCSDCSNYHTMCTLRCTFTANPKNTHTSQRPFSRHHPGITQYCHTPLETAVGSPCEHKRCSKPTVHAARNFEKLAPCQFNWQAGFAHQVHHVATSALSSCISSSTAKTTGQTRHQ